MSATDWIIDGLLVLVVLRQIRTSPLTARSALIPIVILAAAASQYLKGFPTGGNDVWMDLVLIAAGAVFGVVSGLSTKVWKSDAGQLLCQAGVIAAGAWVLGMGLRMAFDIWAHTSSGLRSLVRFSIHHHITGSEQYATAFVLMAVAQVLTRVGIMQYRRTRAEARPVGVAVG